METMSIYDGLAIQKKCFQALGETGRALSGLGRAMRSWVDTLKYCAEVDNRIQAICTAIMNGHSVRDTRIISRLENTRHQLRESQAV